MFLLVSVCCDTAQAFAFLLVSVCCDTAQAFAFLLVSMRCDTAQAFVFLLVSMRCDTAQAFVFLLVSMRCDSIVTQFKPRVPPTTTAATSATTKPVRSSLERMGPHVCACRVQLLATDRYHQSVPPTDRYHQQTGTTGTTNDHSSNEASK